VFKNSPENCPYSLEIYFILEIVMKERKCELIIIKRINNWKCSS